MKFNIDKESFFCFPFWKMILLVVLSFLTLPLLIIPYVYLYIAVDFAIFSKYMIITFLGLFICKLIDLFMSLLVKEDDFND